MIGLGDHMDGLYKLQVNDSFLAPQASFSFPFISINNVVNHHQTIPIYMPFGTLD
jgi:hypothetical protein